MCTYAHLNCITIRLLAVGDWQATCRLHNIYYIHYIIMTLGPMIVEQLSVIIIHNYPLAKGGIEFVITLASVGCRTVTTLLLL